MKLLKFCVTSMKPEELPLEIQFALAAFPAQIEQLNELQAKQLLVAIHKKMLVQEVMYKRMIAHKWGIENVSK